MTVDIQSHIDRLKHSGNVLLQLLSTSPIDKHWKQNPDKWSLLEILCHLCDEEIEDFRQRTKYLLEMQSITWPPIDPVNWVESRNYNQVDYTKRLQEFIQARESSLLWLEENKTKAGWQTMYEHPRLGIVSAYGMLCNWLTHDYLHIRQITRLHFDFLVQDSAQDVSYAGNW
jgi:hypothetical protein